MTQASNSFSIVWPQLLYALPIIFVSIAAAIVCIMNWQKAPTAATFCLIGFGLIGFNSIFGTIITAVLIHNGGNNRTLGEMLSLVGVLRVILGATGYVFLLIAVFQGRNHEVRSNLFESPPAQPATPR
jgi:hypothetical protein